MLDVGEESLEACGELVHGNFTFRRLWDIKDGPWHLSNETSPLSSNYDERPVPLVYSAGITELLRFKRDVNIFYVVVIYLRYFRCMVHQVEFILGGRPIKQD